MTAPRIVLRDGETVFDHAAEDAPEHGPLTAGADMLTALSHNQLRCLQARMVVVSADYSALRAAEGWGKQTARTADLDATWAEVTGLLHDIHAAWDVVLRRDGAQ